MSTPAPALPARLLEDRTVLVTGVLRPSSLATAIADTVTAHGGGLVLTAPARTRRLTEATAAARGWALAGGGVVDLDLTDGRDVAGLASRLRERGVERLDGVVHAVAQADRALLGDSLLPPVDVDQMAPVGADHPGRNTEPAAVRADAPAATTVTEQTVARPARGAAPDVRGGQGRRQGATEHMEAAWQAWQSQLAQALAVSVASLPALAAATRPLLAPTSSVVTLTFVSDQAVAGYGWMGPMKAALEAAVRALAVELGPAGVRVNAVSAGPLLTPAGGAVPGIADLAARWQQAAPLGWDGTDAGAVAATVTALLSGLLPATTGQVLAADGGARLGW